MKNSGCEMSPNLHFDFSMENHNSEHQVKHLLFISQVMTLSSGFLGNNQFPKFPHLVEREEVNARRLDCEFNWGYKV